MTSSLENTAPRRSVRTLLLWLVLVLVVPGIVGVVLLLLVEYRKEQARLERDTLQMVRNLGQAVDSRMLQVQALAQGLANADSLAAGNLAAFYGVARRTLEQTSPGLEVVVSDRSGQQVLNTLKPWGEPLPRHGNPEMIRKVFETGRPVVSNLFLGSVSRRQFMTIAVPVIANGQLTYTLNIAIPPARFDDILAAQTLPAGWVSSVFDANGALAARSRSSGEFVGRSVPEEFLRRTRESAEGTVDVAAMDGTPVRTFYSASPTTGWGVAIAIPKEAMDAHSRDTLALLALGMAGLLCTGLALAWMLGGRIARSIQALEGPAAALGAGKTFVPPRVYIREAGEVMNALGAAASLLQERTQALEASNRSLQAREGELAEIHRLAAFGHWQWNVRTGEVTISKSLAEIYGRDIASLDGGLETVFRPEDWEGVAAAAREAIRAGQSYELELEATRSDGTPIWIRAIGDPVRDESGEVTSLRGMVQDITAQKKAEKEIERLNAHLERRVEERTAELQAANRELEGFTYATSHDLRAPLGRINSFSSLLEQQYRDRLEGNGLLFLDFIRQNTTRLIQLVDDLLDHTRVGQQPLVLGRVELSGLVRSVLREKGEEIDSLDALVKPSHAPGTVLGDAHTLAQALGNVLGNALKFSAAARPPIIEIGGQEDCGRYILWVRDNGIGFDMAYHDKIFDMFGRLQPQSEYEGSGIGLAMARRAMERMGGRIWAESEPGKGATFFLELQASPCARDGAEAAVKT